VPIHNAPTCSRRTAALAVYAANRDCPRCPGNSLSASLDGENLPNSTARELTEPPASSPRHHFSCGRCRCGSAAVHAGGGMVRVRPTVCHLPVCDWRTDRELPAARPGGEMGVLSPVATGRWRTGAIDASSTAADRTIVARPILSQQHSTLAALTICACPRFPAGGTSPANFRFRVANRFGSTAGMVKIP
jgi:hypothetical protein